MKQFSQGALPLFTATLLVPGMLPDTPVDLTGASVVFLFFGPGGNQSGAATVLNAAAGQVSYQFTAGQTDATGSYQGQWQVTNGLSVVNYPSMPFPFEIVPGLPVPTSSGFTKLSDLYDDVRALAGDFKRQLYEDATLRRVMQTVIRLGRVKADGQRWSLAADGQTLVPAIGVNDLQAYSLLVYNAAHTLVLPNMAAYNYRTRALTERFGEQKDFLFTLQNVLYDLEEGEQAYANISGLRSWLFAVNGIWMWSYLEAERNIDVSFK